MSVSSRLVDAVDPTRDEDEVRETLAEGARTFGRTFWLVLVTHGREPDEVRFQNVYSGDVFG